jgi:hypothetical protein
MLYALTVDKIITDTACLMLKIRWMFVFFLQCLLSRTSNLLHSPLSLTELWDIGTRLTATQRRSAGLCMPQRSREESTTQDRVFQGVRGQVCTIFCSISQVTCHRNYFSNNKIELWMNERTSHPTYWTPQYRTEGRCRIVLTHRLRKMSLRLQKQISLILLIIVTNVF